MASTTVHTPKTRLACVDIGISIGLISVGKYAVGRNGMELKTLSSRIMGHAMALSISYFGALYSKILILYKDGSGYKNLIKHIEGF